MTSPTAGLPGRESIGKTGTWTITDQDGVSLEVTGDLLGLGSSSRPRHQNHPDTEFAPKGVHCSTCRWTEIRIFGTDPADGKALAPYLVVKAGVSVIPAEQTYVEWDWIYSGHEVLAKLATRKGPDTYLTQPASRALAQAAEYDGGMRDAYINYQAR